jgi:copper(I)-binding protein
MVPAVINNQLPYDDDTETTPDGSTTETATDQPITVLDPWVRATIGPVATEEASDAQPMMMAGLTSAAYMTLENHSDQTERLISVTSDAAAVVEIHETSMENDVMQMHPVDGVDIPANGSAELKPGGLHIMLMDVQRDLQPEDIVTLTLTFESGLELIIEAPVRRLE